MAAAEDCQAEGLIRADSQGRMVSAWVRGKCKGTMVGNNGLHDMAA